MNLGLEASVSSVLEEGRECEYSVWGGSALGFPGRAVGISPPGWELSVALIPEAGLLKGL